MATHLDSVLVGEADLSAEQTAELLRQAQELRRLALLPQVVAPATDVKKIVAARTPGATDDLATYALYVAGSIEGAIELGVLARGQRRNYR